MRRLAAFCCAWFGVGAHAQPLPPPVSAEQAVAVVNDDYARMSVPVAIAGQPWHFLIDTASTRTVIASDVADSLHLAQGKTLSILTITGREDVPSVIIPELGFADFVVSGIEAPSLVRGNLGADGLLGLDILRNNRVTIDFQQATALTIAPSTRPPDRDARPAGTDVIVVRARSRMGELIVTNAEIGGTTVSVILDTGSQESIGNPALARMMLGSSTPLNATTLVGVTGRTLPCRYALVGEMRIGGLTLENVPMAIGDVATFRQFGLTGRPAILLGMQTLRLFARVVIDFPRRQIRFAVRRGPPRHGEG